jgi:hypothetical protein
MFILAIMSIFVGYLFSDIIIGIGTPIWNNSILVLPYHDNLLIFTTLSIFIKDLPLIFTIIGILYVWGFLKVINKENIYNNLLFYSSNIYYKYLINISLNYYYSLCNIGYNAFFFNNLYNYIFILSYNYFIW